MRGLAEQAEITRRWQIKFSIPGEVFTQAPDRANSYPIPRFHTPLGSPIPPSPREIAAGSSREDPRRQLANKRLAHVHAPGHAAAGRDDGGQDVRRARPAVQDGVGHLRAECGGSERGRRGGGRARGSSGRAKNSCEKARTVNEKAREGAPCRRTGRCLQSNQMHGLSWTVYNRGRASRDRPCPSFP